MCVGSDTQSDSSSTLFFTPTLYKKYVFCDVMTCYNEVESMGYFIFLSVVR